MSNLFDEEEVNNNEEVQESASEETTEAVIAEETADAEETVAEENTTEETESAEETVSEESDEESVTTEEITEDASSEETPSDESASEESSEDSEPKKRKKPVEEATPLTDEEKTSLFANIEAILFALGNSVSISKLCEVFELNEPTIVGVLEEMKTRYEDSSRGIELLFLEGSVQLGTKKETYEALTKIAKIPAKYTLTDTVLETLSIIAYKQPVTRAEIEKIRGVSCDHAISKLIEFDLIEDVGRLEAPGHPLLFGTTEQFLRSFGVTSIGDLPEISPELFEDFKHQAENEAYGKSDEDGVGEGEGDELEGEEDTIVEV